MGSARENRCHDRADSPRRFASPKVISRPIIWLSWATPWPWRAFRATGSVLCDAPSVRLCDSMTQRWSCRRREFSQRAWFGHVGPITGADSKSSSHGEPAPDGSRMGECSIPGGDCEACDSKGVALFVDATHGGGWHTIDVSRIPVSMLSLAPHRFHGPAGWGCSVVEEMPWVHCCRVNEVNCPQPWDEPRLPL